MQIATIGDRIRAKRKQHHMTQQEIAQTLGLKKQTINRYESGAISNIPLETLKELARILDTTPSYLMGWDAEYFEGRATPLAIDPMLLKIVNNYELLSMEKKEMFTAMVTAMFPELT